MDSPFTMVVWIVAISCAASVLSRYLKTRAAAPSTDPELGARLARIEARLAAIETVVADGDLELKRRFAELEGQ